MILYILILLFIISLVIYYILKITKINESFLLYFAGTKGGNVVSRDKCINNCINNYSRIYCNTFLPDTFRLNNKKDMDILNKNYNNNDWFIAKKTWGQQRNGLRLIQKKNINNESLKNYDEIQKLILNSLKINNRVFHIRIFVIIDCRKGNYIFNNGIIQYCKEKFDKNNIVRENVITVPKGKYTYKTFYDKLNLPKTLIELYKYLDKNNKSSKLLKANIKKSIEKYFKLYKLCIKNPPKNYKTKHIFGPDVIIQENLNCLILEVNQGPDLKTKIKNKELLWDANIKKILLKDYRNSDYSRNFIKF